MKSLILIPVLLLSSCASIPVDKKKHLAAGIGISFTVTLGTKKPTYGLAAGCLAGAGKEYSDSQGTGTPELADFVYTCAGSGLGYWLGKKIRSSNQ